MEVVKCGELLESLWVNFDFFFQLDINVYLLEEGLVKYDYDNSCVFVVFNVVNIEWLMKVQDVCSNVVVEQGCKIQEFIQ